VIVSPFKDAIKERLQQEVERAFSANRMPQGDLEMIWDVAKGDLVSYRAIASGARYIRRFPDGWIQPYLNERNSLSPQVSLGPLIKSVPGLSKEFLAAWKVYTSAAHDPKLRVMVYHVPWLWRYSTEDLSQEVQLTGSHGCHRNLPGEVCIEHVNPVGLATQRGFNYCSPCVCYLHEPACHTSGPEFVRLLEAASDEGIAAMRARFRSLAHALPPLVTPAPLPKNLLDPNSIE